MSDYTVEMFDRDQAALRPVMDGFFSSETLNPNSAKPDSEETLKKVVAHFIDAYGKRKGLDFEIRYLTTTEFISHYQPELIELGFITQESDFYVRVQQGLLALLLDSFNPPQTNISFPSSPLLNQDHRFNFKKVLKILKASIKDPSQK
jgi:hypothetical protein